MMPNQHGARRRAEIRRTTSWAPVLGLLAFCCTASALQAASVCLAWDAPATNTDGTPVSGLTGYRVYYGNASRIYPARLDVGLATKATVTNLQAGMGYFLAVTAYNAAGKESAVSKELAWTAPATNSPSGTAASVDSDGDGMADARELLAGTDPHDRNDVLRIHSLRRAGASLPGMVVAWASVPGRAYTVARGTDLLAVPAFTDIATHVRAQGPVTLYTDTTATGEGFTFYRIEVEP